MRKKVLLAFDDPGGGLAVSALIDRLNEIKNLCLEIYVGALSEKFLSAKPVQFRKINSLINKEEAEEIIRNNPPNVLVTSTSWGNAEQELRNIAFVRNINSVVILDFWKNYKRRWLYATYEIEAAKERICVIDELMKEEMIDDGFPKENLVVTGHPYLDKIFARDKISFMKNELQKNSFLFLSQPLNSIGVKNYKVHPFQILLNALKRFSEKKNTKILLTIKLHPSEHSSSELSSLIEEYNGNQLNVRFSEANANLENLIRCSEAVIGYSTIAMFEARALGKRTISLNAVAVTASLIQAMRATGIEIVKVDVDSIYNCLISKNNNQVPGDIFKGGIENCMQVIMNEVN